MFAFFGFFFLSNADNLKINRQKKDVYMGNFEMTVKNMI